LDERKEICRKGNAIFMRHSEPWFLRRWYTGDVVALAVFLLGLTIVLFVMATGGECAVWTLWAAVPMIMFSLGYLFLVSALPIFLGPRSGGRPPEDSSGKEDRE
jgi:protein-S-isoprenylcysteine O-methyltransferase Ste14